MRVSVSSSFRLSAALAVLFVAGARAQTALDPVERLRLVLRSTPADPALRDTALRECVGGLRGLGELRRALLLSEWRSAGLVGVEGQLETITRRSVAERFQREVRDALHDGDAATVGLIVNLVGETAAALRTQEDGTDLMRPLGPDLAELTRNGDPRVRAAAAQVLGQIDADAAVAVPALVALLTAREPALRRAALAGFSDLLEAAGAARFRVGNRELAERAEFVRTAEMVLAAVGKTLNDPTPEMQRLAAGVVGKVATMTGQFITDPPPADPQQGPETDASWHAIQADRFVIRSLVAALREPATVLLQTLERGDRDAQLPALKALEEIATVRQRWVRQAEAIGESGDLLLEIFQPRFSLLAMTLDSPDARVRRGVLEVLEHFGAAAAPTAPAVAAALDDPDRFVRWTAVRTLRTIGPASARCATPGLARRLEDSDLDVRLAAAAALEQFAPCPRPASAIQTIAYAAPARSSPFARTALPPLLRAVCSEDVQVRSAAMRTLRGFGPEAAPAVPALRTALADSNPTIRQVAVETLGSIGPAAREAAEDLQKLRQDLNEKVRRAAGEALVNVMTR
jgi:HEAT repeat protein